MMYFLVILLVLIIVVPAINLWVAAAKKVPGRSLLRIGHRGAADLAPENTLPAIDSGLAYKVNYIEIDIRETLDGELVVMHDKKVNRTTNGKGAIRELNYSEINKLDASVNFPGYSNTQVPLLQQVLSRIKASDAKLIIEIKDPKLYPHLVDKLVQLIKDSDVVNKVAIFSFYPEVVQQVKKQLPGVETGVFCVGLKCPDEAVDFISPNWIAVLYSPSLVKKIHKQGKKVLVWTPDQAFWMNYLDKMNVDGIITNRPDVLDSLLNTISEKNK